MEDISTHTTRLYSLTHSAQETGPSAEQIGQMTTDIYGSRRLLGAVLACQRPQKANQVPAPACLLPTEFTLHYYTSHTPAHSRSERYNQLLTDCLPLPLTLNLSSSSISRQQSPPPIRSPQIHKPPPTPPCLCSHQPSRKSRLVRVCRLFDSRQERLHRRAIESTLERLICLSARTAHLTT